MYAYVYTGVFHNSFNNDFSLRKATVIYFHIFNRANNRSLPDMKHDISIETQLSSLIEEKIS